MMKEQSSRDASNDETEGQQEALEAIQRQLDTILGSQPEVSALPVLGLDEYRMLASQVPCPTAEQIEAFSLHVSEAKSWYKHLPLLPPGEPFTFFIDPWAGLDRILAENGRVVCVKRTAKSVPFHYTWMPTREYRSRFGRLAFATPAGSRFFLPVGLRSKDGEEIQGLLANNPSRASLQITDEFEFQLPPEVSAAGTTNVTGVVHKLAARAWVWLALFREDPDSLLWPQETGGPETLRRILARSEAIKQEAARSGTTAGNRALDEIDDELEHLLAPERGRLQQDMVLAMNRVVTLLYGSSQ